MSKSKLGINRWRFPIRAKKKILYILSGDIFIAL